MDKMNQTMGVMPCCGARLLNPIRHNPGCRYAPKYEPMFPDLSRKGERIVDNEMLKTLIDARYRACLEVLGLKNGEYTLGGDRLSNFKTAAGFQHCTPERALWGMVSKHLVAISDNVDNPAGKDVDFWLEKIGDSINYLFLLDALLAERGEQKGASQ